MFKYVYPTFIPSIICTKVSVYIHTHPHTSSHIYIVPVNNRTLRFYIRIHVIMVLSQQVVIYMDSTGYLKNWIRIHRNPPLMYSRLSKIFLSQQELLSIFSECLLFSVSAKKIVFDSLKHCVIDSTHLDLF